MANGRRQPAGLERADQDRSTSRLTPAVRREVAPMIHIPALRLGKPYVSLEKTTLIHHATGEPAAEVSQVNGSMIARDIARMAAAKRELAAVPARDLVALYA